MRAIRFKIRGMKFCIHSALTGMPSPVRVLDLATGPVCGNVMYTSGFDNVSEIVCCDFLETNRRYVEKIISQGTQATDEVFDWKKWTQWAYGNPDLVESFRRKCKQVSFVDMCDKNGKGFEQLETSGKLFDLITSEWAICEGTCDLASYEKVIRKCNSLLRKGGAFILLEVLEESFWVPDGSKPDVRYPRVKVSQEWLLDCLKRNGFAVNTILLHYYDSNNLPYFDAKGNILVWATKL
ncbi:phenylethanolamine N-methyltransferase-like [Convolutriloba macropyga]|uniref:phenylethanolamine N-methyltransferase-like n=1 Tax=Convolutriloba macropyga TaxID=536237 RepID=UPI003F5262DD